MKRPQVTQLRQAFGSGLRHARKARGWGQSQLADAANLSIDMISRIERGDAAPSFDSVEALAKALGISPLQLFSMKPTEIGRPSKRSRALLEVHSLLSRASDTDVEKARRVLAALLSE